ncbi:hypothetical protein ACHAXS_013159 [Conticribra weissflogii]
MDFPTAPSAPPGKSANESNDPINPKSTTLFGDASKARREALKEQNEKAPPISLSNLCPIEKYYAAADKVLDQFKTLLKDGKLDDAYIIGRRFALFSTVSLPKHDYYSSSNPLLARLRIKNQKDAQWVTRGVERIVEVMDKEELQKQEEKKERMKKKKEEEERQRLEWERKFRERLLAVESSGLGDLRSNNENGLDMTSKLAKLNDLFPKDHRETEVDSTDTEPLLISPPDINRDDDLGPLPPPVAPPAMESEDLALFNPTSATQQLKSNGGTPMFLKLPSYSDLFLDTLRTPSSNPLSVPPSLSPSVSSLSHSQHELFKQPKSRTPTRVLQSQFSRALESLNSSKHIEFIRLATYQGRLALYSPKYDSTNGCAVISPLVVATHICPHQNNRSDNQQILSHQLYGITNVAINEIIDKRSPPVLRAIRSKLGLNQHALIIPSDVHDYLVDEKILPQEKFVGVCGGNILDEDHTNELIDMLMNGIEGNRKKKSDDQKTSTEKKDSRIQKVGAGESMN